MNNFTRKRDRPERRSTKLNKKRTNKNQKSMANINDVFGGNALKAEDLKNSSPRVTIEHAEIKDFDDGKKIILRFAGKDKVLICNKTNASIIAEVLGSSDTDDWLGKSITLTTKKVEFQGKLVPAIRVVLYEQPPQRRQAPPTQRQEMPPPDPADDAAEDDIPF